MSVTTPNVGRRETATSDARHWPGIMVAALTATVTVMPGFTVGALAPWIGPDLHISRGALGLAMSAFYAATALGSPVAKRLAARLPIPAALALAGSVASVVMLLASQASGFAMLTTTLVVGGLSNGLVQPGAGRLIAARTPAHRRSLASGMVGAALAAATLVPGLLVAFVREPYGWRAAMLTAGLVALVPVALAPLTRTPRDPLPGRRGAAHGPGKVGQVLALWALAAAMSAASNNAVATYFVTLGTGAGLDTNITGTLLASSAIIAIAVRIAVGALTDRAPNRNPAVITAMMLAGGIGLALIAIGTPATFIAGATLTFSAGWGWTGLLLATTLRLVPERAENAGHTVQAGVYAGASVAPFTFSALSTAFGFTGAALIGAIAAFTGAASITAGALLLRRNR